MPTWAAKIRGSLERMSGSLVVQYDPKDNLVFVSHIKYGHLIELDQDDENPVLQVRDVLMALVAEEDMK